MVTTLNRQNPPSFDAAPTEVQMKLGISQVLSMPFAYNSPVIVLDFEVGNKNIIKGRFKDAIRSRVFEFEIGDSITFKPFIWKRTDSLDVDPVAWEDYSKGYCYRFDVAKTVRKEKPKCGNTSYNCGKACIGLNKNCKSDLPDKPSQEKVDKLRAAAGKFKAVQDDPTKKQEDNKLTPKPPETKPTLANEDKMRDTLKKAIAENELNKSLAETAYQKYHQYQNGLKNEAEGLSSRSIANLYQIPHATAVARINGLREAVGLGGSNAVSVDKELGGRINDLLNNGKQIKINLSGGQLKDQKKEPSQTTINADKKWSDFLESKNVTEKGLRKLDPETRKKITEEFENTRIEERAQESRKRKGLSLPEDPKPSPDSTGVKGAGGKSVDQQYKDIIASSKDPKGTEEAIAEALSGTLDYKKQTYERYLAAQASGTVPPGYEKRYQEHIDQYKPVIEAEQFFNERRQKAVNGDFETEAEVMAYMGSLKGKYKNSYEFYDSPEYTEKRSKIESIIKNNYELPPPLSGNIPRSELKKTLSPGDKLLVKENTYGSMGSSGNNNIPTGYNIREGGEVTKVAVTNVVAKKQYSGQQNAFESKTPMKDITHVIRDGKRYKVDDSDSSPNDLKPDAPQSQKAVKQKSVKQKTIKVQEVRSPQESPLVPKEEIVKETPKLIGDGTHDGTPKNAQEYYEAMVKKGENITIEEAEKIIKSVKRWITDSDEVRDDQKDGRPNKNEENINRFMKSMTPYDGDVSRGILFNSREEVETWLKGDENGVLDNQKAHASWTSDDKVAYDFSKASYKENPSLSQYVEGAYPVIIKAKNKTGVSIKDVGLKPQESEVIVSKDAKHKVKSVTEKNGIFYVETEEI
jgi:hypothetical protein